MAASIEPLRPSIHPASETRPFRRVLRWSWVAPASIALALGIPSASAASSDSCVVVVCSSSNPPPTAPPPGSTSPTTQPPATTTTTAPRSPSSTSPQSTSEDPSGETQMLAMLNQSRAQAGLAPLTMRDDIRSIAVRHSFDMAAAGYIYHNDSYFSSSTRSQLHAAVLGENVDMNFSVAAGEEALMNSPHHRANILDARFVYIGIGVVETSNGDFYITQDFVQPADGWRPVSAGAGGSGGHGSGLASAVPVTRASHVSEASRAPASAAPAGATPVIQPGAIVGPVARSLAQGAESGPGPSGLLLLAGLGGLLPGVGGLIRLRSRHVDLF